MTDPVLPSAELERPRRKREAAWSPDNSDKAITGGRRGLGRAEIAAELKCSLETLRDWETERPEFREALTLARTLALAWWEDKGRQGVENGKLNATLWAKNVAGRFPEIYGERGQAPPARKAGDTGRGAKAARPITDRDRAKALGLLMAQHPEAFERVRNPAAAAVAATGTTSDGPSSED